MKHHADRSFVCRRSLGRPGLLTLLALLGLGVRVSAQTPTGKSQEFVILGARIFDGRRVIPRGDVWVQNGAIKAVGPSIDAPANVRAIDASGKTLLPGLIDAHVHTMGEEDFLRTALALGVTTELDMGAAPRFADRIEREQAAGGDLDMADLRSSRTQPTAPDGHGTEYGLPVPTLSSPEEAQAFVDARIAEGADFIGEVIYDDGSQFGLRIPTLSRETLSAVIEAAHRRGKLAVVHVLSRKAAKEAVAAGADGLVHLFSDRPTDDEFVSLVVEHHAFAMPTLSLLASMAGAPDGPSLSRDGRLEPYLSPTAIADLHTAFPKRAGSLHDAEETVRRLHAAGVPILAGTDGHNPGTAHGASLLGELQLLVDSGLAPAEALACATSVNAGAFRLNDRGVIASDKRADLLLVAGDPTTRISDIRNVAAVWKAGVACDRDAYRNAVNRAKEAERAQRQAPPPAGSELGLVSDFEDGTPSSTFGSGWNVSTGRLLGGAKPSAHMSVVDGGARDSRKALEVSGRIEAGVFGWAGAMFFPGSAPMAPVNLSGKRAISFWTKGDGKTYDVMLFARSKGSLPMVKTFLAGPEWKMTTVALSDLGTDGSDIEAVMFGALATPGSFQLEIDDVRFER